MPTLDDDPWVASHLRAIGPERLHALGVVTLRWNLCEYALFSLFCEVAQVKEDEGWILAHNVGDIAISERILALAALHGFGSDAKSAIENALDYYDACRKNRNSLMHAWTRRVSGELVLARKSKKMDRADDLEPFASALPDLRRVAEDLDTISRLLFALEHHLRSNDPREPMPWLETPPPPKLLWTPPQVQKGHQPPP
jgi:hypothetical protein